MIMHPIVRRLLIAGVAGLLLAILISEGSYQLLRNDSDRDPQEIELIIPAGTAAKVAAGQPVPTIPENMVFVVGDVLVVKNQDVTDHQLGPVWIPPNTSGRFALDQANKYSYGCSFKPSRYLGLDVVPRGTSLQSRILAVAFVAPPTIALIALYSLLVIPLPSRHGTVEQRTALDIHLPSLAGSEEHPSGNGKPIH